MRDDKIDLRMPTQQEIVELTMEGRTYEVLCTVEGKPPRVTVLWGSLSASTQQGDVPLRSVVCLLLQHLIAEQRGQERQRAQDTPQPQKTAPTTTPGRSS